MMNSFKGTSEFCYQESMAEAEEAGSNGFSSLLDIYVHHARDIHNICIYADQDVYAKFSLTSSPDEALSTRVINGGGKNPQFGENLQMKITHPDTAVLKCEIWMLSRARNYLEDQLLGFTLVPLSSVAAKGKLTQDFTLSSTDLFHSPAGTVQLTLSLDTTPSKQPFIESPNTPNSLSISSEVVLLDPAAEFRRIEFPDMNIATENQKMVSEYFGVSREPLIAPFLHLGSTSQSMEDYDMTAVHSSDENTGGSDSPDGSVQNSGPFTSSTTTSLGDDRNSADSTEKKSRQQVSNNSNVEMSNGTSPETPTSISADRKVAHKLTSKDDAERGEKEHDIGSLFKSPLGNVNHEEEQNAMQQQIVDMYMRSMQQFTESLAKMKLPMDLDIPKPEDGGDVIQSQKTEKFDPKKKKDGSRVFYGSRAFF